MIFWEGWDDGAHLWAILILHFAAAIGRYRCCCSVDAMAWLFKCEIMVNLAEISIEMKIFKHKSSSVSTQQSKVVTQLKLDSRI